MNKYLVSLIVLIGCSLQTFSQSASSRELEETGVWMGLYLRGRINDKWYYYGEHHYRRRNSLENTFDFIGRMRQLYNRAGALYVHNEYFNVVVGPTLVWNWSPQPGNPNFERTTIEPRIWHQWLFSMPYIGRVKLYHQFRFEHRWKRDNNLDAEFEYTDRYRYKIFAYIPLNKPKLENKTLFFSPSAEIFMHTGSNIEFDHLEDFRIYTAIGYIFNSRWTFFGGHMWTNGAKSTGNEFSASHIIRLNMFYNFNFKSRDKIIPQIMLDD